MSHSFTKLIYPCYLRLAADYPEDMYSWEFEKALVGAPTRVMPDIQILDHYSKVQCVAEIGYTNAAKILVYHKMGIADIRWYTKKLELVYRECNKPVTTPLTCRR